MTEQEKGFYDQVTQLDDLGVEEAIENVKEIQADIKRLTKLAEDKKEKVNSQIDKQLEEALMPLEKRLKWQLANIRAATEFAPDAKSTKTQIKKTFLSGEVVIKKPKRQIVKPDDKNNKDKLKEAFPEFFEEVKSEKFKWAELKKSLTLDEKTGKVFYLGEDVTELVESEVKDSEVVVK